jgi:hypothetical protein
MGKFTATFHAGPDDRHTVDVETDPDDDQTLEEWLAEKLESRLAAVDTDAGPVLYPVPPRFAAFSTPGGGFQMIPIDKITLIEVEPAD